ncbi:apolipoprotein A1/A4/E family protein [Borrelia puertoricensis]|uniref:apolipoprotein A1/A4/E family protein n=1 Tax=Borrelia puertoricensis TaxID=2756107 RepID=UPI001FF2E405|nr:apolipoprotein A1/A4/E family protein [Borrelia puertoricensis]UPA19058.1 apolipoprotein A1/A4/E family protein [Borrelia puertoricensis]
MSVEVKERVNDEDIAKSAVRPERVKKGYHSVTFDGHIISYYVLEEKFDIFQDRMLDNFHYLDDKINIFRNELNEKIETVKNDLNERIDGVETRLNEKIDNVETRLNEKIDNVETRLNEKIDSVETRLNEKIDKLDTRIDKLDEKIEVVKTDLVQINSRLTLIESKLGFKGQLVSSLTVVAALAASYFVAQLFVSLGKYLGIS